MYMHTLQVYKGLLESVHEVAIKVLPNSAASVQTHNTFLKEVALLQSCRHPHIVQVTHPARSTFLPGPPSWSWKGHYHHYITSHYMVLTSVGATGQRTKVCHQRADSRALLLGVSQEGCVTTLMITLIQPKDQECETP